MKTCLSLHITNRKSHGSLNSAIASDVSDLQGHFHCWQPSQVHRVVQLVKSFVIRVLLSVKQMLLSQLVITLVIQLYLLHWTVAAVDEDESKLL